MPYTGLESSKIVNVPIAMWHTNIAVYPTIRIGFLPHFAKTGMMPIPPSTPIKVIKIEPILGERPDPVVVLANIMFA